MNQHSNLQVIGLTGGIGSGKSLAAKMLADLGVTVIDADVIAKTLTQAGTPCTQAIIDHFGPSIATPEGELHRDKLADIIFTDESQRTWLEQLLHPAIREAMAQAIDHIESDCPYCICVIPLLAENWPHPLIDEVLLIETDQATQLERICQRDQLSPEAVQLRLKAQASPSSRRTIATYVIQNNDSIQLLRSALQQWHQSKLNKLNHNDK